MHLHLVNRPISVVGDISLHFLHVRDSGYRRVQMREPRIVETDVASRHIAQKVDLRFVSIPEDHIDRYLLGAEGARGAPLAEEPVRYALSMKSVLAARQHLDDILTLVLAETNGTGALPHLDIRLIVQCPQLVKVFPHLLDI